MAAAVTELRNASCYEILMKEGTVELWSYALESDPQEIILRLQQSLSDSIALSMSDALDLLHFPHERIICRDKIRISVIEPQDIVNLDVSAKANHLIANGVLESENHPHGDDHHSQTNGDPNGGNTDSRTTDFPFVALITINLSGYE